MESTSTQTANHSLKEKYSTRTVLLDDSQRVAILNVKKHGYYKIPGGGIEAGEDLETAAKREVLEEAGCNCNIIATLGRIKTEIPVWGLFDISEGFIARVIGEKAAPNYEAWEIERGFELEWFDSLDSAIATFEKNQVIEPGMESMQTRDLQFLKLGKAKLGTLRN